MSYIPPVLPSVVTEGLSITPGANLPFNMSGIWDPAGYWDTGNYRITAKGTELWRVQPYLDKFTNPSAPVYLFKNGVSMQTVGQMARMAQNGATTVGDLFPFDVPLTGGDYIDVRYNNAAALSFRCTFQRIG